MTPAKRQKVLLGVLGVLLLVVLWRYFLGPLLGGGEDPAPAPRARVSASDEEGGGPSGPPVLPGARGGGGSARDDVPSDRALEVNVAALEAVPHTYRPGRDPWRYGEPPPPPKPPEPPPPTRKQLEEQRLAQELAAQQAAEEAARIAALPPPPPQPPPFTMKYLGSFGPPNRQIAVFNDGKTIYNVRQGDVLQGKFLVARIGYESVDIQFVGFPDAPPVRKPAGR